MREDAEYRAGFIEQMLRHANDDKTDVSPPGYKFTLGDEDYNILDDMGVPGFDKPSLDSDERDARKQPVVFLTDEELEEELKRLEGRDNLGAGLKDRLRSLKTEKRERDARQKERDAVKASSSPIL